ncbi:MAG: c-type cytochrome [Verrucomicrobia bacterium]|nr:c-type cytochrome [Verrucomicrobiota bacterium]
MSDHAPKPPQEPGEDPIRHHVFDGIAEYDKRLPNWWLLTLYASIIFAIGYWMSTQHFRRPTDGARVTAAIQEIRAAKLAAAGNYDDAVLAEMSRNVGIVTAGAATFQSTCASCHGANLEGGIGFNLVDATWVHGGKPSEIMKIVTEGVLAKGMPTWGPVLGPKKIAEVVAFVLSKQPSS